MWVDAGVNPHLGDDLLSESSARHLRFLKNLTAFFITEKTNGGIYPWKKSSLQIRTDFHHISQVSSDSERSNVLDKMGMLHESWWHPSVERWLHSSIPSLILMAVFGRFRKRRNIDGGYFNPTRSVWVSAEFACRVKIKACRSPCSVQRERSQRVI